MDDDGDVAHRWGVSWSVERVDIGVLMFKITIKMGEKGRWVSTDKFYILPNKRQKHTPKQCLNGLARFILAPVFNTHFNTHHMVFVYP